MTPPGSDKGALAPALTGRYLIFFAGRECGEERWRISAAADELVVRGEQVIGAPHPFPNRQEYRATFTPEWRPTGLEVLWTVGSHVLRALHRADARTWRASIEYEGRVTEQRGDYPDACEVEYSTHLFNVSVLARRDFALHGEHEFPVLRIGPPHMAVSPERMLYRCVEVGTFLGPAGAVKAKRYTVSLPPRGEDEGYTFWADEDGFVLESYEGLDLSRPWMRLTELRRSSE